MVVGDDHHIRTGNDSFEVTLGRIIGRRLPEPKGRIHDIRA
jgi:hypothetical protein